MRQLVFEEPGPVAWREAADPEGADAAEEAWLEPATKLVIEREPA